MTMVLVTRPSPDGEHLCAALQTAGFETQFVPTLKLESCEFAKVNLAEFDYTIFISPASVRFFVAQQAIKWPVNNQVAVIGSETARACSEHHIPVALQPTHTFSSEALLALADWQNCAGKKVLLIKGAGGRDVIVQRLSTLGASVTECEVYRRAPLMATSFTVEWPAVDVVIATSLEALQNLTRMQSCQSLPGLLRTSLLVSSARLQQGAQALGFTGPFILSPNATTPAIVHTLITAQ